MQKKFAAVSLAALFLFIAAAPETFAQNRGCRARRSAVAGRAYYNPYYANRNRSFFANRNRSDFRRGRSFYRERDRRGVGSTGRAVLTVAAPAAVAAGVGAIVAGKKGAAVGALLGGGGGAAYYLLKNRRRYR
jgi:hypothetical protein